MYGCGGRSTQPFPILPRMRQARPGSFPQYFPFELRENGEEPGHPSPGWGGQVQRLSQRDQPHAEVFEFLERRQQIRY